MRTRRKALMGTAALALLVVCITALVYTSAPLRPKEPRDDQRMDAWNPPAFPRRGKRLGKCGKTRQKCCRKPGAGALRGRPRGAGQGRAGQGVKGGRGDRVIALPTWGIPERRSHRRAARIWADKRCRIFDQSPGRSRRNYGCDVGHWYDANGERRGSRRAIPEGQGEHGCWRWMKNVQRVPMMVTSATTGSICDPWFCPIPTR